MDRIKYIVALLITLALPIHAQESKVRVPMRESRTIPLRTIKALHAALAPLTIDVQRDIMAHQTPAMRSAMWTYNIDEFSRRQPELGQEQRDVLAAAKALFTAEFFEKIEAPEGGLERLSLEALHARAEKVLDANLQYEVFFAMTNGEATSSDQGRSVRSPRSESRPNNNCECRYSLDCGYDFWNFTCQSGFDFMCEPVPHNCGFAMTEGCVGICL